MSIKKYQPWSMFDQLHREINDLFDRRFSAPNEEQSNLVASDWQPAVDVKEEEGCFLIKADLPGIAPEAIEVTAKNCALTIKGQRKKEYEETKDGVHRIERSFGSFMRSFALPGNVDADAIEAKAVNGVLEVVLPKSETKGSRKIEIKN